MTINPFRLYKESYSGLPRRVWLLSLVSLINRSGSMVLFFLTLYLTGQLGFSAARAAYMISIYGLGALAGSLLGGRLSDRIGANKVQLYSLLLNGLGFILLSFIHNPLVLAPALFLTASIGEAFRPASITAITAACPPDKRARGIALNRLAINLGVTLGPAVGGFLAAVNYKLLFWIDGLTCMLAALFLWNFLGAEQAPAQRYTRRNDQKAASVLHDHIFLGLLFLLLIIGLTFMQFFSTWPLYLKSSFGLQEKHIGLLVSLNTLLIVLVEMPLVHKLEKKNIFSVILRGCLFIFAGFAILPLGQGFYYAAFTVVLWTIGEMLVYPLAGGFIANRARDENRGSYMGLLSFTFSLGFVLGPTLGGWVYQYLGPQTLWYGAGLLAFPVSAGFVLLNILYNKENETRKN